MPYPYTSPEYIAFKNEECAKSLITAFYTREGLEGSPDNDPQAYDRLVKYIASILDSYRQESILRAASIMGNKITDEGALEKLVWYRMGGEEHGYLPETWKDRAEELERRLAEAEEYDRDCGYEMDLMD